MTGEMPTIDIKNAIKKNPNHVRKVALTSLKASLLDDNLSDNFKRAAVEETLKVLESVPPKRKAWGWLNIF